MNFIQPFMLWGMLAIAIPIFIHIWNKKKGVVIEWATTQWLLDKSQQQHRGIQLDNIPLLILRCLLLILLAFLLSQPVIKLLNESQLVKRVHLVEPTESVVENYRFELESALKKGEKVYWLGSSPENISSVSSLPANPKKDALVIQKSINKIGRQGEELNLYITNNQELAVVPAIYVPKHFQLHTAIKSVPAAIPDFKNLPEIHVLLDYRNPTERQTVRSALEALVSVYSFPLVIDFNLEKEKKYDWILTDKIQPNSSPQTLYVISGLKNSDKGMSFSNVFFSPESFQIQTSEIVSSGQLPEWLGELLISHYKLDVNFNPLSNKQLGSLFVNIESFEDRSWEKIRKWLMVVFTGLLIIERSIALKKMNV